MKMSPETFEENVRELRRSQKRFFSCNKNDPDREKSKQLMREEEKKVREIISKFKCMVDQKSKFEREQFFLSVAVMMEKQTQWMKNGGGLWNMGEAKQAEKEVDNWLKTFDERRKAEKQRAIDEELARQPKLF